MCLYPRLMQNPKYKPNKKNNYKAPPCTDERVKYVPVACGKCMECMKKKQREWAIRLTEEIRENKEGIFVTLTFNNESYTAINKELDKKKNKTEGYDRENEIATTAVRKMLERYRKKNRHSVKHWLITEIGKNGSENIHIHGIIFEKMTKETLQKYWQYGYSDNGQYVSEKTINYITKYVTKNDGKHKEYTPIIMCSAGIGSNYIKRKDSKNNEYKEKKETNENYKTRDGRKIKIPMYYRNKLYTDEQKEELWKQKLDKKERWILGQKIDISEGEEEYNKLLKYYQKQNEKMGYGSDKKNWKQEQYERERRLLKQAERIEKAKKK